MNICVCVCVLNCEQAIPVSRLNSLRVLLRFKCISGASEPKQTLVPEKFFKYISVGSDNLVTRKSNKKRPRSALWIDR